MPRHVGPGWIRTKHILKVVEADDWNATTAVDLQALHGLGYEAEVEAFGIQVGTAAWTGTAGTLTYEIVDSAATPNVIAQLVITLAGMTAGAQVQVTAAATSGAGIRDAFRQIRDGTTFKLRRLATGTVFTAGTGEFFLRLRQQPQQK
jgi:hypothetical protein